MNGYYNGGFDPNVSQEDASGQDGMMLGQEDMNGMPQDLESIINSNAQVIRRQSMPQGYQSGQMGGFGFDNSQIDQSMMGGNTPGQRGSRDLALNTSFGGNTPGFSMMAPGTGYNASPAHASAVDLNMQSPFVDPSLGNMQMDFNDQGIVNQMMFDSNFNNNQMASPMAQIGTPHSSTRALGEGAGTSGMNTQYSRHSVDSGNAARHLSRQSTHVASPLAPQSAHGNTSSSGPGQGFAPQPQHPPAGSRQDRGMHNSYNNNSNNDFDGINGPAAPVNANNYNPNNQGFPWQPEGQGWPSTMVNKPHMQTAYKNAYSSTGFDMLGVLMRVATRPNAEINIGSVDLSCAFVVCDAEKDDFPIVYCSENFERLTGYTKHMILGRNCRFLQSPDGNVAPGIRRKYVDDDSVLYLKNMINLRREAQISLINYRRGGQPFMNLLTMIPINWDSDQVKYFVGFQVDLVEQPNAVTNRNPDGSYSINYQRGMTMPRYTLNTPETATKSSDLGQTIPREDVAAILGSISSGDSSEYAKRLFDKVLLENTDDVICVLSLKGLFQWVSPSVLKVLEYEPSEIVGTALSSVAHPSDIVPVTRELKDTSSGTSVSIVFRIRRKKSGYVWFESYGSLHTEQGKGRKSIILVGRERPVYTLNKNELRLAGGIGENELWTKISTAGMFLFVSSNVRSLLDRQPDELVGISIQTLMRTDSKQEFGRILEHARAGKRASCKHEMINRRGQVLSAYTTLFPGDAVEGQKATFIISQTKMIKFSRSAPGSRPSAFGKDQRTMSDMTTGSAVAQLGQNGDQTPGSAASGNRYTTTNESAVTYAGVNGPEIGNQDQSLASDENLFEELKTTKSSSWQYEIRQLERRNRLLAEEMQSLIAAKKKRKRRKGAGNQTKDCANCHTRTTPEWRRGPSGQRDLCNSCGLRWAKLNGRVSPRTSSQQSVHSAASDKASKASASPRNPSGLKNESPIGQTISNAATPGIAASPASPKSTKPAGVPPKIEEESAE